MLNRWVLAASEAMSAIAQVPDHGRLLVGGAGRDAHVQVSARSSSLGTREVLHDRSGAARGAARRPTAGGLSASLRSRQLSVSVSPHRSVIKRRPDTGSSIRIGSLS